MANVFANTVKTVREVATVGVKVAAQVTNVVNDTHTLAKESNEWYNKAATQGVAAAWDADRASQSNKAVVQAVKDTLSKVVPAKDETPLAG